MHCLRIEPELTRAWHVDIALRIDAGTWSTHVIAPADSFTKVDLDVKKAGIEAVAAAVVPYNVAKKLLESAALKSGKSQDVVHA